jgi:mitogen-activated protein kinase 7
MADLQGRKVFKVFNQDFIVDGRYTVTKELGQGAYGTVWYVHRYEAQRYLAIHPSMRGWEVIASIADV